MKRFLAPLLIAVTLAGCSPTWWSDIKNNPVAYTTTFIQYAETFLTTASSIFAVVLPLVAADKQPAVQAGFQQAVQTTTHALAALQDAVQAAADAKNNAPDFTKAIADVQAGVEQIQAIIDGLRSTGAGKPGASYDELAAEHRALLRWH
jgi:hypothetical protein